MDGGKARGLWREAEIVCGWGGGGDTGWDLEVTFEVVVPGDDDLGMSTHAL